MSWALALVVIGLTLFLLIISTNLSDHRNDAASPPLPFFALLFFLVALPWPTMLERPVVAALTRAVAVGAAEMLGILGVPALAHGNLIETRSGLLGIEEACSGIRSFQISVAIGLFFGEFFQLAKAGRLIVVLVGMILSLLLNLVRTMCLAFLSATIGMTAMARWHDLLGVGLPLGCFAGVWCVARCLRNQQDHAKREIRPGLNLARFGCGGPPACSILIPLGLALWIGFVEAGTEAWYHLRERELPPPVTWQIRVPQDQDEFRKLPLPEASRQILRYDEGLNVFWSGADQLRWQAIFLRWNPGRVAACLARNHTPKDCLSAVGERLLGNVPLEMVRVHGLDMPFRVYSFGTENGLAYVFYCLWPDRAACRTFAAQSITYSSRISAVLAGERNLGQRSLELVLRGARDAESARTALKEVLEQIVRPDA